MHLSKLVKPAILSIILVRNQEYIKQRPVVCINGFAGVPILPQITGGHNVDNLPYDRDTRDLLQDGYNYHAFPWMVKLEGRCEGRGSMNKYRHRGVDNGHAYLQVSMFVCRLWMWRSDHLKEICGNSLPLCVETSTNVYYRCD